MTTPAEHDALDQVISEVRKHLPYRRDRYVGDVISALRRLVADPGTRPTVLVALGLGGEGE